MNSDDEDALEDVKPDEEQNMYTAGMDPTKGPIMLSLRQVAAHKAAAAIIAQQLAPGKALPAPEPERQPTPVSSYTEDQGEMTENQKRCARIGKKKATATRKASVVQPVPEAKASKPVIGQESPETKVSKPMRTRRQAKVASGAGGLRGIVGSGSTGYVCDKWSPSSKPGS
jgi:hypothetical protein